jgi:hypothetical protein
VLIADARLLVARLSEFLVDMSATSIATLIDLGRVLFLAPTLHSSFLSSRSIGPLADLINIARFTAIGARKVDIENIKVVSSSQARVSNNVAGNSGSAPDTYKDPHSESLQPNTLITRGIQKTMTRL